MWNKKEKAMGFASGSTTLISKTSELVGDIKFSGNLEIEGKIRGNVSADDGSDARVRIMDHGLVEGEIHVPTVVINGLVKGDVHSSRHVELAAKAEVYGNVHYSVIEMVKGAQLSGKLVYSGTEPSRSGEAGSPLASEYSSAGQTKAGNTGAENARNGSAGAGSAEAEST